MENMHGKVAFVTGAASGLGLAMSEALGRAGMKIMMADINPHDLEDAVERLRGLQITVERVVCDVTSRSAVEAAAAATLAAFGKVHVCINNAGVAVGGPIGQISPRDWDWIIDVNLKGVVYGVETFAPLIARHGEGGHIVNVASMAGMVSPANMEPYSATKFAVVAMSEGWAQQLAAQNIGVCVLCPGFVKTRIHESDRNKPPAYGQSAVASGLGQTAQDAAQMVMSGIDPGIVGARVIEAILNNETYVFTHPDMKAFVETRFAAILAAFDRAADSPAIQTP